jgi:hypothetical protein
VSICVHLWLKNFMDRAQQIQALHNEYCRLTRYSISLMGREWCWFEWLKRDLTIADLRAVADTRSKIVRGELTSASLQFRNLIGQVDYAEEKIAELRARHRNQRTTIPDRDAILRATGRTASCPNSQRPAAQSAGEIINNLQSNPAAAQAAFEELRKLKNRL